MAVVSLPAPPRPERVALLNAVTDDPDDDTPRLVPADWLDETGSVPTVGGGTPAAGRRQ
jgi:uncharacterized protein (TIGR02996 family)